MWLRKGGRRIGLEDFDAALELISQKKGMRLEDVWSQVRPWKTYVVIQFCKEHLLRVGPNLLQPCFFFLLFFLFDRCCGGPVLTSTKAETVRFYDDKSTYTGTHAQGGPDPGRKGRGTGLSRPQWGCQTEAKVELSIETIETMTLLFLDVFLLGFTDHGFTPLVLEPFLLKQFCWKNRGHGLQPRHLVKVSRIPQGISRQSWASRQPWRRLARWMIGVAPVE